MRVRRCGKCVCAGVKVSIACQLDSELDVVGLTCICRFSLDIAASDDP